MPTPAPASADRRRRTARLVLAAAAALLAIGVAWPIYHTLLGHPLLGAPQVTGGTADEAAWRGDRSYAADPQVGHRQARSVELTFKMGAIGATAAETLVRRSNNHGCIAVEDWPDEPGRPRVVAVGDSHAMGVVGTADNFAPLLQDRLRGTGTWPEATVLNASAGFYSLYQCLLRIRQLLTRYRPEAVVVVLFAGNDLLELDDVGRPHLDDDLAERGPNADPPAETTGERLRRLALPEAVAGSFWQGLNQAAYLHLRPERDAMLRRKAAWTLRQLRDECAAAGARLTVVLLPPFDVAFPTQAAAIGGFAAEVVQGGAQRRLYAWLQAELQNLQVPTLDLLPGFVAAGRLDVYAADFHVWRDGHRAIADGLSAMLREQLSR